MHLTEYTLNRLKKLSQSDEFDYFFSNMKHGTSEKTDELLQEIAFMCVHEFEIKPNELEKLKFFLRLAFYAQEEYHETRSL